MNKSLFGFWILAATATQIFLVACGCQIHSTAIENEGLAFVQVGDTLSHTDPTSFCAAEKDAYVQNGNGFIWMTREFSLPEGSLMIEGEFLDSLNTDSSTLAASKINRITIRSAMFEAPSGLRVGDNISKIQAALSPESIQVSPFPKFEVLVIFQNEADNHLYYHISDPGNSLFLAKGMQLSLADIPSDWKISEIAVM